MRGNGPDRARVGLLGLNAWAVIFLVPSLHLPAEGSGPAWAAALVGLALLGGGVVALGRRPDAARAVLLALFPVALGLTGVARPALVEREVLDPLTALAGAGSLLAFVAAAAWALARGDALKPATTAPTRAREPVVEPPGRRWTRRALLGLTGAGGFAIVAVAALTSRAERLAAWGEAREDGVVLAIVVASVLAAFAVGGIVGPALRAERRPAAAEKLRRRRVALALALAALAACGWGALAYFDAT
ncbi:MAG: hypothetical protein KF729_04460 [Sandaracinaceae bacterium]|nr:hypothetical protein [Sandaracinaceae bacterium]